MTTATGTSTRVRPLVTLGEWKEHVLPDVELTERDRRTARALSERRDPPLRIEELRDGLRIRARSWIGVIGLDAVEIRVEPKLSGGRAGLVRMVEYSMGVDGLAWKLGDAQLEASGGDLLDLIGLLFARASERVIRRGLLADYVEREEWLPVVRGRLLADRQLCQRMGRLDRLACRYDELVRDLPETRVLAATARDACRRLRSPRVRRQLARVRDVLDAVCGTDACDVVHELSSITYDRQNAHYAAAHQLARLYWQGIGVEDLLGGGAVSTRAFLLDMNELFERFVERWLVGYLRPKGYDVVGQERDGSVLWNKTEHRRFARIIPDVVVRKRGAAKPRLALDAKYKLYAERKIDTGDVYQAFMYSYTAGIDPAEAVLVFPTSAGERSWQTIAVRRPDGIDGAYVHALGLPLVAMLDAGVRDEGAERAIDQVLARFWPAT